jgi:alpha-L-rhamnosidase
VLSCRGAGLREEGLQCEYRVNPLGLDVPKPRLSWLLESSERGQRQTAYQVLMATSLDLFSKGKADLWDSGKVSSGESVHVVYGGQPLRASQRAYWKVRAWDREDRPSAYSATAWWEMGLLAPSDWRATWITRRRKEPLSEQKMFEDDPAPLFRKEFQIGKKISQARVYVSGLGYYELHLNG